MLSNRSSDQRSIEELEKELNELERVRQEKYKQVGKNMMVIAEREQKEIDDLTDAIVQAKRTLAALKGGNNEIQ